MKNPLVTVAIPSYNHEKYVSLAIESVLRQSYKNIELIVIDDGSTDNSPALISALAKKYPFQFIARENKTLPVTLNDCLAMARGDYFCEFSSDDIMFDDYIEQQIKFMQENPYIGMAGAKIENINENGLRTMRQFASSRRSRILYSGKPLSFNQIYRAYNLPAPGMFFRTEVIKKMGGFLPDIKLEDLQIQYRLAATGIAIAGNKNAKIYYRQHPTNTGGNRDWMHQQILMTVNLFKDHPEWENIRRYWYVKLFRDLMRRSPSQALDFLPKVTQYQYSPRLWRYRFMLWWKLNRCHCGK